VSPPPEGTLLFDAHTKAARDYWVERMTGVREPGGLPLDRRRSKVRLSRRRSIPLAAGPELTGALRELAGDSDLLLYAALSSALATCLRRYGARERVVFGSPTAGGAGGMVPIAVEPPADATFEDLLVLVRDALADAYAHSGYPLDRLAADLGVERVDSREPFFDVVMALDGFHDELPELANDVTVVFERAEGELTGRIEYNHRLHHEDTVRRFAGHLTTLLAAGVARPGSRIDALEILPAEERELLEERSRGRATAAAGEPEHVHGMFAEQVERTPDAPALIDDVGGTVTYRELSERVGALASAAGAAGAGPGEAAAICLEASGDFVVAALAVLTTGANYMPVDPGLPAGRVASMVGDARPVLAIGPPEARELLGEGVALVGPDAAGPPAAVPVDVPGDAAAYTMFTSGSTGQPKGVRMPHRALVNLIRWQRESSGPELSSGRTLLRTPPSFDVSFQEVFCTLCCGGTVVVASRDARRDMAELAELIAARAVQRVFLPFVALQLLAREAIRRELRMPALRELVTAGEQLKVTPPLVEFFRRHPDCTLQNQYGPTEAHVVTAHTLSGPPTRWEPLPPIGTPIDNVSVLVLDALGNPVPFGIAGELHIGGVALADGYQNRPDLTAERFTAEPGEPGRLFRTGDLARVRGDGSVEYLGRDDRQVKVRGFRVELEEVEAALLGHPEVAQAAAVGRADDDGTVRLDAYVVPTPGFAGEAKLRDHLAGRLPEYMVPRSISPLDELPLTPTGKVDYLSLPEPDRAVAREAEFTGPRSEAEAVMAQIWSEVLELDRVSVTDDFLELGGDSILATQAVALAAERGVHLRVRDFFLHPTIAELGALAPREARRREARPADERPAPLTPVERWFFDLGVPDPNLWNITVLLEVDEALDPEHLDRALVALAEHHEALRFVFEDGPGGRRQVPVEARRAVTARDVDLEAVEPGELEAAIARVTEEVQGTIDIESGPLLAGATIRVGGGRPSRLLLVAHHLVTDGVSWRIVLHDLQTAYRRSSAGEAIELPARTTSYQEWAHHLVDHAQSDEVRAELDHWTRTTAGEFRPLPRDREGGNGAERTSRRRQIGLTEAATDALLREVPAAYRARIDEVLLSALLMAFHDWTGEPELLIELEGHGREEVIEAVDLSRTVGWFSTMFPVALSMPGEDLGDGPGAVVRAVKQRVREIPYRGIGYGMLRMLSDDESVRAALADAPRPEVRFNYLGRFDGLFAGPSMFRPAPEPVARMVDPDGPRPAPLSVQGQIVGGRLTMTFDYSHEIHDEATVEQLAQGFEAALLRVIGGAGSLGGEQLAASDFPRAGLDEADLRTVLGQVADAGGDGG
jgi:amino acid adenylation domain-containing protein/non-ribosomal peptide synthase protein (TIGR01720 family)